MDNTLLIGLSRQTALQRQLEIIANNIANVNTTGFKADGKSSRNIGGTARRREVSRARPSPQLRAGSRGLARCSGSRPRDRQPARRRDRRQRFFVVQTPPANATPATARCRSTPRRARHRQGDPVVGDDGPITFQPTDKDHHHHDGTSRCARARISPTRCAASCASLVRRRPAAAEGRRQPLRRRPASRPARTTSRVLQGAIEKSNVNAVTRNERMIEITRTYTQSPRYCSNRRPAPHRDREARRSSANVRD